MDYGTLLRGHVTLTCRSVDRIFLQAYVPQLQTPGWVARFLLYQRHFGFASGLALGKIGDRYLADIRRWAKANDIPIHYFQKGESKEAYARPLIQAAAKEGGDGRVVLLGIAQEKTLCWKSWRAKGQEHAAQPHGVGPSGGVRESLLLLPLGPRLGRRVLEDQHLLSVADLDLPQRTRVGQASTREGWNCLRGRWTMAFVRAPFIVSPRPSRRPICVSGMPTTWQENATQ